MMQNDPEEVKWLEEKYRPRPGPHRGFAIKLIDDVSGDVIGVMKVVEERLLSRHLFDEVVTWELLY